ncbi:MAG: SNF2-related protein [Acidimicrobiales bacterium]
MPRRTFNPDQLSIFDILDDAADSKAGYAAPQARRSVRVASIRPSSVVPDRIVPTGEHRSATEILEANMAALNLVAGMDDTTVLDRDAKRVLAEYRGFGAIQEVFEPTHRRYEELRSLAVALWEEEGYDRLRRSVLNAHYTHPRYVEAIWTHLSDLGLASGEVLEPGCGSGGFFAQAPDTVHMVGVEMEPAAAAIAAALYPMAKIHSACMEDTTLPFGHYAAAVGNVPYANVKIADRRYGNASIHNYFLLRAVDHLAPGGVAALLTSRYTLDAASPSVREALYARADLLGALRLPVTAHRSFAGCEVVTDLLVLRRRKDGEEPGDRTWLDSEMIAFDEHSYRANAYFTAHRQHQLGDVRLVRGPHQADEPVVCMDGAQPQDIAERLRDGLASIAEIATARRRTLRPQPYSHEITEATDPSNLPHGCIAIDAAGSFYVVGSNAPYRCPSTQASELRALLRMRDLALQVLDVQASGHSAREIQAALITAYDAYVESFGPINRASSIQRTVDEDGVEEINRRTPPMGGFRKDPLAGVVFALETYDYQSERSGGITGLAKRDVLAPPPPAIVESVEDGLIWSLNEYGRVDEAAIGAKLAMPAQSVRVQLLTSHAVFEDPESGDLVEASDYLSGHVGQKREVARRAAVSDERFAVNVEALDAVMPPVLGIADIAIHPGAPYISTAIVSEFLVEHLSLPTWIRDSLHVHRVDGTGLKIAGGRSGYGGARYEVGGYNVFRLFESMANNTYAVVTHTVDGKPVIDTEATLLARQRQDELLAAFVDFVRTNEKSAETVVKRYDEMFGGRIVRRFDGASLPLPGLALDFEPHDYQKAAAFRMANQRSVLLAHPVGAGKTAITAMGLETLRRMGKVRRPMIVVPNHLLDQYRADVAKLYPRTRVLAASPSWANTRERMEFTTRIASGDYDLVIITASAFARIPVAHETVEATVHAETRSLRTSLTELKDNYAAQSTVKSIEKRVAMYEGRLKRTADMAKDVGPTFESLGIDYLVIDEAHMYKNLERVCTDRSLSLVGSKRAFDLYTKLRWLDARRDGPYACFATATPVANSIAEVHTMLRFLAPEALAEREILSFDAWLSVFGRRHSEVELSPEGGRFRLQTRFSRFVNVPELVGMLRSVMETPPPDAVAGHIPALHGEKPIPVVVPPNDAFRAYVAALGERADRIRARSVPPQEDNMLKVVTDGRKAALDMRLVGEAPDAPKIDAASERIAAIYQATKDKMFKSAGSDVDASGTLQIVFLDMDTPIGKNRSAYHDLKERLLARGVPAESVAFVHEAATHDAKAMLFQRCRTGDVNILIGSTERMGLGTNIQDRAIALHHLDCPWRPAEVVQREGRILRQGNHNEEVAIYRYATEASFDVYMWQTVERKARFIAQVMNSSGLVEREVEDVDAAVLSYGEIKALAAGNPLIMERVGVETELRRCEMMSASWRKQNRQVQMRFDAATLAAERYIAQATALEQAASKIGNGFHYDDGQGHRASAPSEVGELFRGVLKRIDQSDQAWQPAGAISGVPIVVQYRPSVDGAGNIVRNVAVAFENCPLPVNTGMSLDPVGLGVRLKNVYDHLDDELERVRVRAGEENAKAQSMQATRESTDPYTTQTLAARKRLEQIDEELAAQATQATSGPLACSPTEVSDSELEPLAGDLAAQTICALGDEEQAGYLAWLAGQANTVNPDSSDEWKLHEAAVAIATETLRPACSDDRKKHRQEYEMAEDQAKLAITCLVAKWAASPETRAKATAAIRNADPQRLPVASKTAERFATTCGLQRPREYSAEPGVLSRSAGWAAEATVR